MQRTLAVISGVLLLSGGCSAAGPAPAASPAPASASALISTPTPPPPLPPTPTPSATAPTIGPVKAAAKRWAYTFERPRSAYWKQTQVLNVSGHFVSHLELNVRGFTGDGRKKWERNFPGDPESPDFGGSDAELHQAAGVLIMSYEHPTEDAWPQPNVVEALDPATGRTLWKNVTSPYQTVVGDTVYTPLCRGKQTGRQDDCMLSARDARTGRARWTIPTEHVPFVLDGDDTTLVMRTQPKGVRGKFWLTTLDKRTGARLGLRVESRAFAGGQSLPAQSGSAVHLVSGKVIQVAEVLVQEAGRCDIVEAARDARTGKRLWRAAWQDPGCEHSRFAGGALAGMAADGRPTLRDPATGEITWTGTAPGRIIDADGDDVLVSSTTTYTVYGDAHEWSVDATALGGAFLMKGRLLATRRQQSALALDLRTGSPLWQANGRIVGAGDGWLATIANDDGKKTIRVYPL